MASKKKSKKRSSNPKRTARKKASASKTVKRPAKSKIKFALQSAQKPSAQKKKASGKKKKKTSQKTRRGSTRTFSPEGPASRSGEQSGDWQVLTRSAAADSESVNELLEEGNAFEADAVLGVEQ